MGCTDSFVPKTAGVLLLWFSMIISGNSLALQNALVDSDFEYGTNPHDLDLERFYTAEYKRLPVYDFGLGKRPDLDEAPVAADDYDEYPYNTDDDDSMPELDLYHDDNMQSVEKRQRSYNFGLGKRQRYDFGLGKRAGHGYDFGLGKRRHGYDFGLGKRSLSLLQRDRLYNMGLGKRNRAYSFGLGKRPYNPSPIASRFNFGLGKRSDSHEPQKNGIAKREVQEDKSHSEEGNHRPTTNNSNSNNDGDEDDLRNSKTQSKDRQQGPGNRNTGTGHVSKRSPYGFSYGEEDSPNYKSSLVGFSRQFRKPLYNFGLGKRNSLSDETLLQKSQN